MNKYLQNKRKDSTKTLVFYINTIGSGGAERMMVNLTKCFADDGYKVILVNSFRDTWEYEVSPLVKRIVLEEDESKENIFVKNIKRIHGLRKICKIENADALISFMREPNVRALMAGIGLKVKTIISVRSDPNMEYAGFMGSIVRKYLLPQADGCVFQTKYAKAMFPPRLQDKSAIIYNMVKEEFYHIKVEEPKYIVSCGRLGKEKNYEMLIRAYEMLDIEDCPQLRIYGQGPEKEALEKLIQELNLEERAFLCGQTNDVADVLREAKLFVLTSDFEGMPNALMEAMAAGVPCIATDCPSGGVREVFGKKLKEYLVPVGDVTYLAQKITMILKKNCIGEIFKEQAEKFRCEKVYTEWKSYLMDDILIK